MGSTYAGIDWASEKHDVLVAEETGKEVLAATFAHDENGLRALCRTLVRLEVGLVAIERPDGLLVERLLDAGLRVLPLHPNQVAAARDRFRVSGGKSDRFDAFVLCELARTDHHRFRVLEPDQRSDQGAQGADPRAGGSRRHPDRAGQPAARRARAVLARSAGAVQRLHAGSRSRSLSATPARPTRAVWEWRGCRRFSPASATPAGSTRAADGQAPPRPRARVGELELGARRELVLSLVAMIQTLNAADQAARAADRDRRPRAPRRADLPLAVQIAGQRDHRRGAAGRDRRLPRALPHPRRARRRRRPSRGRDRVRQTQDRRLPLGLQQAPAPRVLHARGHQPPLAPLGPGPLRRKLARGHDHPRAIRTVGRAWCRVVWRCWHDHTPTTPPATAPCNATSPSPSRPRRAPCPTSAATQRMAGAAVTQRAARRAERAALIGHPGCCLDRRRERARRLPRLEGLAKTSPSRRVVRCRKRQQDVAPVEGLSMSTRNGTSWSGRCEVT